MNWYKSHHGMPSDPVWAVVAKRAGVPRHAVVAVWCALLDHASQNDPRGSIARLDDELIAVSLDLETEQVNAIVEALRERGKIDGVTLANWEKRQKATSTERVRRYRDRKSVSGNADETENETVQPLHGNDETIDKSREEKNRKEQKEPPIAPRGGKRENLDDDFGVWWLAYPRRVGRGQAEKAYRAALKLTNAATLLAGAERYAADKRGEDPRYVKHPATWLNGKCWLDEPEKINARSKTTGGCVANTAEQRQSDNAAILAACGFSDEMAGGLGASPVPRAAGDPGDVLGGHRGGSGRGAIAVTPGPGGSAGGGTSQTAGLLPSLRDERAGGSETAAGDLGGTLGGHTGRPAADGGEADDGRMEVPDAAETSGPAGKHRAGHGGKTEAAASGADGAAEGALNNRMPPIPAEMRRTA